MPIVSEENRQPIRRYHCLKFLLLVLVVLLLLLLPLCMIFNPGGCRIGTQHVIAEVTFQPASTRFDGYNRTVLVSTCWGIGDRLYLADLAHPFPVEVHFLVIGPVVLMYQWVDATNATQILYYRRSR